VIAESSSGHILRLATRQSSHQSPPLHGTLQMPVAVTRNKQRIPNLTSLVRLFNKHVHGYTVFAHDCRSGCSTPTTREIELRARWLTQIHATPACFFVEDSCIRGGQFVAGVHDVDVPVCFSVRNYPSFCKADWMREQREKRYAHHVQ
jgi:hypothetical protein